MFGIDVIRSKLENRLGELPFGVGLATLAR